MPGRRCLKPRGFCYRVYTNNTVSLRYLQVYVYIWTYVVLTPYDHGVRDATLKGEKKKKIKRT